MLPAPRIDMACQFRRLEDVVAPGRFRNLAGQIAFQQKTLLRTERPRRALMVQSKRDIEVDRHLRCPLTIQRTIPKIDFDFSESAKSNLPLRIPTTHGAVMAIQRRRQDKGFSVDLAVTTD
jgi:hypothetical protein